VFHTDVAKVDQDVVYIAMVAYVSHICCKCFIWMLRMFCNDFQVFSDVFLKRFRFRRMFQLFHLSSFIRCECCI
jgi:hypothetical protein